MPLADLNADMGESFGVYRLGDDEALLRHVTSANVACGFHGGEPVVMARTVRLARSLGVAVGAHPGYPDLAGFGRRVIPMSPEELRAALIYQIGALGAICHAEGTTLQHVKPHGALYNAAAADPDVARAIAEAVRAADPSLVLVALARSPLAEAGRSAMLRVAAEAYCDRAYLPDGTLVPRGGPGAVITDPHEAAARAVRIVLDGAVEAVDGSTLRIRADTLCVHGDTPNAPAIAAAVASALSEQHVTLAPMGGWVDAVA